MQMLSKSRSAAPQWYPQAPQFHSDFTVIWQTPVIWVKWGLVASTTNGLPKGEASHSFLHQQAQNCWPVLTVAGFLQEVCKKWRKFVHLCYQFWLFLKCWSTSQQFWRNAATIFASFGWNFGHLNMWTTIFPQPTSNNLSMGWAVT